MAVLHLQAGVHYPRSTGEFQSWFASDSDCLDYLEWLRWPNGFVCPRCANPGGWAVADGRYKCASCGARTSVTAGTLFDRRRTALTVWFTVLDVRCAERRDVRAEPAAVAGDRFLPDGLGDAASAALGLIRPVGTG